MSHNDMDDYLLCQVSETPSAWGVTDADGDDTAELIWLPKSRVIRGKRLRSLPDGNLYEFSIPEWLALDKGLL